jgi:threonine 3-dehydrogenase
VGRSILITGLGPIGLMAAEVCKNLDASLVAGTEVSPYRIALAERVGLDCVMNPRTDDIEAELGRLAPGGFDAVLEMSGHPASLELAVRHVRPGGRISLLGVFQENGQCVRMNDLVFKGIDVQGIVGRRLWETWDQMHDLLANRNLDVSAIVTHELPYTDFAAAMDLMKKGEAGKVVFRFE